jgi:UDP-N-acetyl-D-glucosamine/UDP-N-acetyl-D-galactosamine dehydrogenase
MEKIGIIGLGYVGLPLAVEFGKVLSVVGFDINKSRIEELKKGHDRTREVEYAELKTASKLKYTYEIEDLKEVNYFIVTVPTPIDEFKSPDIRPLQGDSKTVG